MAVHSVQNLTTYMTYLLARLKENLLFQDVGMHKISTKKAYNDDEKLECVINYTSTYARKQR
jgi:hypothetical protein